VYSQSLYSELAKLQVQKYKYQDQYKDRDQYKYKYKHGFFPHMVLFTSIGGSRVRAPFFLCVFFFFFLWFRWRAPSQPLVIGNR